MSPRFHVQWRQGELALTGHTSSERHEQDLLQVADSSYPGNQVFTDFRALGIVPDYWAGTTTQILYLLAETASAEAILTAGELTIRSVVIDELGWQSRHEAIRKTLPPEISVSTDALLIDGTVSVANMCEQAFAKFESGPINFEESSSEFRSSAHPRLDRVVALARACRDSHVVITGHTDATGNEVLNQRLSLQRANAVADYIAKGGIDHTRLKAKGVGSAVPIADDATRYGRSLNRRIEIVLSSNY